MEKINPSGFVIDGKELDSNDVGRLVTYIPRHANKDASHPDCETGRILRWNDGGVFVDYIRNICRTSFSDLVWG